MTSRAPALLICAVGLLCLSAARSALAQQVVAPSPRGAAAVKAKRLVRAVPTRPAAPRGAGRGAIGGHVGGKAGLSPDASTPAAKPTSVATKLSPRLLTLLLTPLDRSPQAILRSRTAAKSAGEAAAGEAAAEAPLAPQGPNAVAAAAIRTEQASLQRMVTRGEWAALGEYLATLPPAEAWLLYRHVLRVLNAPPGTPMAAGPDGSGRMRIRKTPFAKVIHGHVLRPEDLNGLIAAWPRSAAPTPPQGAASPQEAAPQTAMSAQDRAASQAPEEALALLGALLKYVSEEGYATGAILDALDAGHGPIGGGDAEGALRAAAVLLAADLPATGLSFLPATEALGTTAWKLRALSLRARLELRAFDDDTRPSTLERAWNATLASLALPELSGAAQDEALERAVELAPRLRDAIGERWLEASFADAPERGRRLLGAIGSLSAQRRRRDAKDPKARTRLLQLQATAVRALLAQSDSAAAAIDPDRVILSLLAKNWALEAKLSLASDQTVRRRPQPRRDSYGNLYYTSSPRGQKDGARPIALAEIEKAAPTARWLDRVDPALRVGLLEAHASIRLAAGDEERAFPLIEELATGGASEQAHALAEELVRVFTDNHDFNRGRGRTNAYMWMFGFEKRADAIPLTRSKQERNLAELARWLQKLRALPIPAISDALLASAFVRLHSNAEVYRLPAIERVFGSVSALSAETLSALLRTMRGGLATVWRDPRVQAKAKTKRKDKAVEAEVLRGYREALALAQRGMAAHPESFRLHLAGAALRFDANAYRYRELTRSAKFEPGRKAALEAFARAADRYAEALPGLAEDEETNDVYDLWFFAGLGATNLGQLKSAYLPDAAVPVAIRAALAALPEAVRARHEKRFANGLFARLSAVSPEVKVRYLDAGFAIVGDHEDAREARQVLDYYRDLTSEIELRVTIDGADRIGSGEPFGLFVDLRHTEAIEREAGGFAKYLQNQNAMRYAWNYGRPLEDYRDKFQESAEAALGEHFELVSSTFHEPKTGSRGDPEPGWRVTPYAYLLLRARGPEVDRIPSLALDLDFLDTSGYVVLPVASAVIPVDATSRSPRPASGIACVLTLDEREAEDGKLTVEIKLEGHGLMPRVEALLGFDQNPAFTVAEVEDDGVAVSHVDAETADASVVSQRTGRVRLRGRSGLKALPARFRFPRLRPRDAVRSGATEVDPAEVEFTYQRFVDADVVAVEAEVDLRARYGETRRPWIGWATALSALALLLGLLARRAYRKPPVISAARYALPDRLSPFTLLPLLREIHASGDLSAADQSELGRSIGALEARYFDGAETAAGDGEDLAAVTRGWIERASTASPTR